MRRIDSDAQKSLKNECMPKKVCATIGFGLGLCIGAMLHLCGIIVYRFFPQFEPAAANDCSSESE